MQVIQAGMMEEAATSTNGEIQWVPLIHVALTSQRKTITRPILMWLTKWRIKRSLCRACRPLPQLLLPTIEEILERAIYRSIRKNSIQRNNAALIPTTLTIYLPLRTNTPKVTTRRKSKVMILLSPPKTDLISSHNKNTYLNNPLSTILKNLRNKMKKNKRSINNMLWTSR